MGNNLSLQSGPERQSRDALNSGAFADICVVASASITRATNAAWMGALSRDASRQAHEAAAADCDA